MGILQARLLEWVAMPSPRGSSQPRDWTHVSRLQADSLPSELPGKPHLIVYLSFIPNISLYISERKEGKKKEMTSPNEETISV